MIWLKYEILYRFRVSQITGNLLGDISSLREHHDTSLCTDPAIGVEGNSHRVEKRSYLPPVTCTSFHEQNAVRSKVHCQPRPRVIRLPWPNDTSVQTVSYPTYIVRFYECFELYLHSLFILLSNYSIDLPIAIHNVHWNNTIHWNVC